MLPPESPPDALSGIQIGTFDSLAAGGAAIVYETPADLVARLPDPAAADRAFAARETATSESVYPHLRNFIQACQEAAR